MSEEHAIQPKVEWNKAREAADQLKEMLADEVSYIIHGDKLKNVYSPIAWVRLCRTMSTLTAGMAVMRLVSEGKTNEEIREITGRPPQPSQLTRLGTRCIPVARRRRWQQKARPKSSVSLTLSS